MRAALPTFLLFGAEGQVGYELARELASLGNVIPFARADADLADADALRAAVRHVRPQVVVNAAAYTAVDAAEAEVERCRLVNGVAPGVIAAAAEEVGAAVVHFSTDYVFDGTLGRPYIEEDTPNPVNVYGATKLEGEAAVAAASSAYLTFRLSWVYGTRGRNFMQTMLRLAREHDELRVVNDQYGAPTWSRAIAREVSRVISDALHAPAGLRDMLAAARGIYHLSAPGVTSWYGFAEAILALDPRRAEQRCRALRAISTPDYSQAARRPPFSVLDNQNLARRLGRSPLPGWHEQLREALSTQAESR